MKTLNYLVILSLASWAVCSVIAADSDSPPPVPTPDPDPIVTPDDPDTDAGDAVTSPAKETEKAQALATKYGITEQQVLTMRQTRKMGWGEINNLLILSQRIATASVGTATPVTMDAALQTVLQQRLSGMGLGAIAKANNVKLGDIKNTDKTDKIEKTGKVEKPEKPSKPEKVEKPEKPAKPEKIEKPDRPEKPEKVDKPAKPEKPDRGR